MKRKKSTLILAFILGLLMLLSLGCSDNNSGSGSSAGLYHMNEIQDYGYLWQLGLSDPPLAEYSCVPTSFTNSMVYLQGQYEIPLNGLLLVDHGYSGWTTATETLRSESFMNTQPGTGTQAEGEVHGMMAYLAYRNASPPLTTLYAKVLPQAYVPGLPDWVEATAPTLKDMYDQLVDGAAVVVSILYGLPAPGQAPEGHAFALVGVDWTDSNNDGVVDKNENARLVVVDPLDPSVHYESSPLDGFPNHAIAIGPTKETFVHVWDGGDGYLLYSYDQYKGNASEAFDPENHNVIPDGPSPPDGWPLAAIASINITGSL